ncbi:MAG: hypothetical protein JJU36_08850 [Phycisphaeraceae bacterium]|nr:hypothetical protein [Phycisphaeraceae bacterium]
MIFTGHYPHTLDAKNRLAIPAELRQRLKERCGLTDEDAIWVYATPGEDGCIEILSVPDYEATARNLEDAQADIDSPELIRTIKAWFRNSFKLELDKQGRMRIPEPLLARRPIGQNVVVVGNSDRMEIYSAEAFQRMDEQDRQAESTAQTNALFNKARRHRGRGSA